jgi:phage gpG-like protein
MNISEFAKLFPEKMREVTHYLEGDGVKSDIGRVALEHVERNFEQEGYVDEALNPWKEVERRKPDSPWYGHSGQLGKPSSERKEAPILHGETRELSRATRMVLTPEGVRLINSTPYAAVHQFGLPAKIYGKKPFTMPKRPFMGRSKVMEANIRKKILDRLKQLVMSN